MRECGRCTPAPRVENVFDNSRDLPDDLERLQTLEVMWNLPG